MLSFSNNPQDFIQDWLKSQSRDLKVGVLFIYNDYTTLCIITHQSEFIVVFLQLMTDVTGNPEEERRAEFYQESWVPEAVGRYVYSKVRREVLHFF